MNLRVRVPSWLTAETEILLNGTCAAVGKPGSYVSLNREWTDGDTVSFRLPMQMKASRYVGQNRVKGFSRYAFEYGPILMALQGPLNESCTPGEIKPTAASLSLTRAKRNKNHITKTAPAPCRGRFFCLKAFHTLFLISERPFFSPLLRILPTRPPAALRGA